jgi:hypothetical protein
LYTWTPVSRLPEEGGGGAGDDGGDPLFPFCFPLCLPGTTDTLCLLTASTPPAPHNYPKPLLRRRSCFFISLLYSVYLHKNGCFPLRTYSISSSPRIRFFALSLRIAIILLKKKSKLFPIIFRNHQGLTLLFFSSSYFLLLPLSSSFILFSPLLSSICLFIFFLLLFYYLSFLPSALLIHTIISK